jgi:hypothetical protein
MGINQECDQLQSILSQSIDLFAEAKSRAYHLLSCSISEQDREISSILDICSDGMSKLQKSLIKIESIQALIGTKSFSGQSLNLGILTGLALKLANIAGDASTIRNVITNLNQVKADPDSFDTKAALKQLSNVWMTTALGDQGELSLLKMLIIEENINPDEIVIKPKNLSNQLGNPIQPDFYVESHKLICDAKAWKEIIKSRDLKNLKEVAEKYANYFKEDGEVRLYFPKDTYEQYLDLINQIPSEYSFVKIRKLPMEETYQDLAWKREVFYTWIKCFFT